LLGHVGVAVEATLERCGFFPAGGGEIRIRIRPARHLLPLRLEARGALRRTYAQAIVANLPVDIAARELAVVRARMMLPDSALQVVDDRPASGPGNALLIVQEYAHVTEVSTGFGQRGLRAETLAQRTVDEATRFARSEAAVGEHLADQLLLPLALAGSGSFTTLAPSSHAQTNIEVIEQFLPVRFARTQRAADLWRIELAPR
jgi:RNA 3'-terminal phosphate cyclase (ATP)